MTIKTSSALLSPEMAEAAKLHVAEIAKYMQAETSAVSGVGETDLYRYTFRRAGEGMVEMRVFPHWTNHEFMGEAYATY